MKRMKLIAMLVMAGRYSLAASELLGCNSDE